MASSKGESSDSSHSQQHKLRDGFGVYVWNTGDVYEGYWKGGKMHEKGTFRWANGDVYEGDWVDGKMTGRGRKTMANGDVYDGVSSRHLHRNGHHCHHPHPLHP